MLTLSATQENRLEVFEEKTKKTLGQILRRNLSPLSKMVKDDGKKISGG